MPVERLHNVRKPGRNKAKLGIVLLMALIFCSNLNAQLDEIRSSKITAGFIFNFIKFVRWPDSALPPGGGRMLICVQNAPQLYDTLTQVVAGKQIRQRLLRVARYKATPTAQRCHVLFVGATDPTEQTRLLNSLQHESVLTISDLPDFVHHGGIIGLFMSKTKLRFEINTDAAQRAQLKMSSRLMKLARTIVNDRPQGNK